HRAGVASGTTRRMGPWVHRGLAVGTLAAGLWLAGSLSQASAAEAAPLGAPAAIPTAGVSAPLGAVDPHSPVIAASSASQSTEMAASKISHISRAKAVSTGSVAAGAADGFGALPPSRSDAADATPPTGSSAARRPVSPVVAAAAGLARSASAAPLPAVPELRTPPLAVPALALPAVLLPTVLVPALPVISARPAKPAQAVPATQPAAGATATPPTTITERKNNASSKPASSSTPAGHPGQRPITPGEAVAALPQQPSIPPIGHRPSPVPGLSLGGGGNHPLDAGLAPTDAASTAAKPAGGCRGRDHTPPRKRASAPSTSPD
ncbi:MAG: hypothetical protein QOE53_1890, partial [Pseudonocardiales bacterium]|nr:hypothetical protein [Pseudonocardiales bacterium]